MALKLTNNATSLLAVGINTLSTSLILTSGDEDKFPVLGASDWCPVVVVDAANNIEIMRCTARSGVTLTVTRAQEDTVALDFAAGARVDVRLTAAALLIYMQKASNLADLTDKPTARTNLSVYSKAEVDDALDALVDSAPGALNTLNELAAALGDDANFAATVNTALTARALKLTKVEGAGLATGGGTLEADRVITVPKASEAEAIAGVDDTKAMTPLRVKQAVQSGLGGIPTGGYRRSIKTASGTWTKPTGLIKVIVKVQAGGGGSGAISTVIPAPYRGGCGAGGGAAVKEILAAALGPTEAYIVGAGGAPGSVGGGSSFGSHCQASGGGGGANTSGSTSGPDGAPGIGTAGDLLFQGQCGFSSDTHPLMQGGSGGLGTPGASKQAAGGAAGVSAPGGSGAGAVGALADNTFAYVGATGGSGRIEIEEFF